MHNFGKIKFTLSTIIGESFLNQTDVQQNSKKLKKFIDTINSSKILKLENIVFKNIEQKVLKNDLVIDKYISENLLLFKNFSVSEYEEAHKLLEQFKDVCEIPEDKNKLFESIHNLIISNLKNKTTKHTDIDSLIDSYSVVVEHLKTDKRVITETVESTAVSEEVLNYAIKKFNLKYSHLSENEKKLLYITSQLDESKKVEYYNSLIKEAEAKIASYSESNDKEIVEFAKKAKEKISSLKESFSIENSIKLLEILG